MQRRTRHGSDFWLGHFKSWKLSGLSQRQYSLNQKVSAKTFSRWCGRIRREGLAEAANPKKTTVQSAFVPLVVGSSATDHTGDDVAFRAALRLRREGTPLIVEVALGADGALLCDVLAALLRTSR